MAYEPTKTSMLPKSDFLLSEEFAKAVQTSALNYHKPKKTESVRLSTLMRLGADNSEPLEGALISTDMKRVPSPPPVAWDPNRERARPLTVKTKRVVRSCAWGAARLGATILAHPKRQVTRVKDLTKAISVPSYRRINVEHVPDALADQYGIGENVPLRNLIIALNDKLCWSRGQIADLIDRLIDEHDYRLSVKVRVEYDREFDLSPYRKEHPPKGETRHESDELSRDLVEDEYEGDSLPEEEIDVEPALASA